MTGEKYKDADVPLCCRCIRFMVTKVGVISVALNHETDDVYILSVGSAYKCPGCGFSVIYKWLNLYEEFPADLLKESEYWYMFLEDHTHYNKHHACKKLALVCNIEHAFPHASNTSKCLHDGNVMNSSLNSLKFLIFLLT